MEADEAVLIWGFLDALKANEVNPSFLIQASKIQS